MTESGAERAVNGAKTAESGAGRAVNGAERAVNGAKTAMPAALGRAMFVFINVLVWVIILCFPFIMATHDGALVNLDNYLIYSWIPLMFMLAFYFNYYFLVDKLIFEKRRWLWFLVCNFVMIVAVSGSAHLLQEWYLTRVVDAAEPLERVALATYIVRDGLVLMLVVGLAVALKMVMAWQQRERDSQRLVAEKRRAEMANLRSQLNPHFLFNTLNNIYSLTLSDGEKAREAILSLSSILRYILYTDMEKVPLDRELDFVRSYVELMKLRTGEGMSVEVELPAEGSGPTVAPLLLMTLVENAFKHGVSTVAGEASFVRIRVAVDRRAENGGAADGGVVRCVVENSDFPKTDADRSGSGIGLDNLRRRLALLYPKSHSLSLSRRDGVHTAELTIEL